MGRQYRYRRCNNPSPVGNGAPCVGNNQDVVVCNQGMCISKRPDADINEMLSVKIRL
ncbi:hypothetical protein DPMN_042948 [Dreissena polymorpha]|uniref:Uncharacterized protein n=1 Tax=Dreissena polymorpha TaxID=45954 RepID=A0A9D4D1Q4_DREPO|nr:hypothetical protein DPMN_042948 [Dreissena polymorpha]